MPDVLRAFDARSSECIDGMKRVRERDSFERNGEDLLNNLGSPTAVFGNEYPTV